MNKTYEFVGGLWGKIIPFMGGIKLLFMLFTVKNHGLFPPHALAFMVFHILVCILENIVKQKSHILVCILVHILVCSQNCKFAVFIPIYSHLCISQTYFRKFIANQSINARISPHFITFFLIIWQILSKFSQIHDKLVTECSYFPHIFLLFCRHYGTFYLSVGKFITNQLLNVAMCDVTLAKKTHMGCIEGFKVYRIKKRKIRGAWLRQLFWERGAYISQDTQDISDYAPHLRFVYSSTAIVRKCATLKSTSLWQICGKFTFRLHFVTFRLNVLTKNTNRTY